MPTNLKTTNSFETIKSTEKSASIKEKCTLEPG